ncbi:MAG: DMT family transporter [Anaerolineaceae bacterium]|jgi:drug/metabolite transporter (DMT)-like permease|nr:DMT family transporter [Anaerolineaceae bacterium]
MNPPDQKTTMALPDSAPNLAAGTQRSGVPGEIMLLLTAFIWGTGFSVQRLAMALVQPFTFIAARFLIGSVVLLPLLAWQGGATPKDKETGRGSGRAWLVASLGCGGVLFLAASFQQVGIVTTTAGKAGFITALYIVIVPILGLFLGKSVRLAHWMAVGLGVSGLYLLAVTSQFTIQRGDAAVLIGALLWALHILAIDRATRKTSGLKVAFGQFLVAGVLGFIVALAREAPTLDALKSAGWLIAYAGIVVVGVAYTLQVLGQVRVQPAVASLILSLESVFALLAGMLFLGERMSAREGLGCVLMLAAVVLAQLKSKPLDAVTQEDAGSAHKAGQHED